MQKSRPINLDALKLKTLKILKCTQEPIELIVKRCPKLEELDAHLSAFTVIPESLGLSLKKSIFGVMLRFEKLIYRARQILIVVRVEF